MTSAKRIQDSGWRKQFSMVSYLERMMIPGTRILKRGEGCPGRGNRRSKGQEWEFTQWRKKNKITEFWMIFFLTK